MLGVLVIGSEDHRKREAVERSNELCAGLEALLHGRRHPVFTPDPRLRALERVRERLRGIHDMYPACACLAGDRACLRKARGEMFAQRIRKQEDNRGDSVEGRRGLSGLVNHDPVSNRRATASEVVEKRLHVARMATATSTVSNEQD